MEDIKTQGFIIDGTSGDDSGVTAIEGTAANDRIHGLAGSDQLNANAGDDLLSGDEGDDTLNAGDGNDTLNGGTGSDLLQGGFGSDTYTFTSGDGLDTLTEGDPADPSVADPASTDRIRFDATVNRSDVRLLRTELGELIISYGAEDEVTVAGQYNVGGDNIEEIDFADGLSVRALLKCVK